MDQMNPTSAVEWPSCLTMITGAAACSRPTAKLDTVSPATSQPSVGSARRVDHPVRSPFKTGCGTSGSWRRYWRGARTLVNSEKTAITVSIPAAPAHWSRRPARAGPDRVATWSMPRSTDCTRWARVPASRLATPPAVSTAMYEHSVRIPVDAASTMTVTVAPSPASCVGRMNAAARTTRARATEA